MLRGLNVDANFLTRDPNHRRNPTISEMRGKDVVNGLRKPKE